MASDRYAANVTVLLGACRDFCGCVSQLNQSFDDTKIPIDDDNVIFHRLCSKIEFLFNYGLKDKSGVFRRKNNPWHYFSACLGNSKNAHDSIRFVCGAKEVKTSQGRLRLFLRFCLVHHCLADSLQHCLVFEDVTNDYYNACSLFKIPDICSMFFNTLYLLNNINFDLTSTGYDLDTGWPTFARKQFSNHNWKTPSRSNSALSIADSQSLASLNSSFASPVLLRRNSMASNHSINSRQQPGQEQNEDAIRGAESLDVERLVQEKEALKQEVERLTQQLDQERQNSCKQQELFDVELSKCRQSIAHYQEQLVAIERQSEKEDDETQEKVSSEMNRTLVVQVQSLREAALLCKKMLNMREGEVELLKKQLEASEMKVEAFKERYQLKIALVMEEIRNQEKELAGAKLQLRKWADLSSSWSSSEHVDDIQIKVAEEVGAQELASRIRRLFTDNYTLAKEVESVKDTNLSLTKALAHHENRLSTVASELDQTWAWLSRLKLQHGQLQSDEVVLRYELKEKRQLLDNLKGQLETSRQKWDQIRRQNDQSQQLWSSIRQEIDTRRTELPAAAIACADEAVREDSLVSTTDPNSVLDVDTNTDINADSNVDCNADSNSLPSTPDCREERLKLMEAQCRLVYEKLVNTSSRNVTLVNRLATLHQPIMT